MPASLTDKLVASRIGICGEITVQDIIDLVEPSKLYERGIQYIDNDYIYIVQNKIDLSDYVVRRTSLTDYSTSQATGSGTAPTLLSTIQGLTYF